MLKKVNFFYMYELIEVIIFTNYQHKFVKNNILTFKSKAFVITNIFT